MKLSIKIGGRTIRMMLPDSGDVEVDLDGGETEPSPQNVSMPESMEKAGPSAKRVYRWMVHAMNEEREVSIDPVIVCEQLKLTRLGLGHVMGKLVRMEMISSRRKRDASGKVVRYDAKILKIVEEDPVEEGIDSAKSLWSTTLEDIEADCGEVAKDLFVALCKMADVDGNVAAPPSEVLEMMDGTCEVFPSMKLSELEEGGWVLVADETDDLCVSVLGFENLRSIVPWRGQQPLPSPE